MPFGLLMYIQSQRVVQTDSPTIQIITKEGNFLIS